jgi:hypothetical protein
MKYFGIAGILVAVTVSAFSTSPCSAQAATPTSDPQSKVKQLPTDLSGSSYKTTPLPQVEVVAPFAANANPAAIPLEFRSEDQMTEADRALAATARARISASATEAGFEFDKGNWSHQQLVCQALPDHLFLIYKAGNGPGDLSLFSVAIPRVGGSVRIIAIERRGFSLFSPASINALTVAAFNRIRSDEPENKSVDWLATALCYASLAGARPAVSAITGNSATADLPLGFPPTLEVGQFGDSTVRFVDVATPRQPIQWALTFSSKGQLLKVNRLASPAYAVRPIPAN